MTERPAGRKKSMEKLPGHRGATVSRGVLDEQGEEGAGPSRGLESIAGIIQRWLRRQRVPRELDRESIARAWSAVVGDALSRDTRAVDLKAGTLVVEVRSSPLLHELSTYYRDELLAALVGVENLGGVSDIRFRLGSF